MDDSQSNLRKGQHRVLTGAEDAPQPLLSSAESITQHPDEFRESTFRQRVANLSELEAYKYDYIQSRRHIRVLTLHPGSGDEEIFCSLVAARLDEPPPYEALSYAWGNPNERHSIRCDNGKFDVTVNLFAALKRLRDISVERLLWIDAICINQKDEIEKGAQVQQMAEIYSSATRVLIWFGEATKSVPAAFEAIRWTRTLFPEQGALATVAGMTLEEVQFYENRHREYSISGEMMRILLMWKPVFELGSRPWFMRKWVIQEVVRGQHGLIVCGSHTLPWDVFEDTFTYMKMLGMVTTWSLSLTNEGSMFFATVSKIGVMRSPEVTDQLMIFAKLVRDNRRLLATVPRDHIISMVHLASDLSAEDINFLVDYSIPTTTEYLQSFMRWSIQTKKTLSFFSSGFDQAHVADPTQPSWIFDINSWDGHGSTDRSMTSFRATAQSLLNSPTEAAFDSDTNSMSITGTIIDEIAVLGNTLSQQFISSIEHTADAEAMEVGAVQLANLRSLQDFYLECQVIGSDDANTLGTPGFPGLCKVLTWESCRYFSLAREMSQEYICSQISKILSAATASIGQDLETIRKRHLDIDLMVMNYAEIHSLARRFSRTTNGRLGSMPRYAEVGDKICLFYGGNFPYVIRQRGDGTYRYIGDCYLDGVMYGKAMVEGRKSEVFTLV